MVRDSNGNVVNSYEYDEWGKIINKTEQFPLPIRYAGYWQDNDTGLYHLGARWYEPTLYRFTSVDPHPGDKDDSLSLNEYLYAKNNPLTRIDPKGDTSYSVAMGLNIPVLLASLAKVLAVATAPAWLVPALITAGVIAAGAGVYLLAKKGRFTGLTAGQRRELLKKLRKDVTSPHGDGRPPPNRKNRRR